MLSAIILKPQKFFSFWNACPYYSRYSLKDIEILNVEQTVVFTACVFVERNSSLSTGSRPNLLWSHQMIHIKKAYGCFPLQMHSSAKFPPDKKYFILCSCIFFIKERNNYYPAGPLFRYPLSYMQVLNRCIVQIWVNNFIIQTCAAISFSIFNQKSPYITIINVNCQALLSPTKPRYAR